MHYKSSFNLLIMPYNAPNALYSLRLCIVKESDYEPSLLLLIINKINKL